MAQTLEVVSFALTISFLATVVIVVIIAADTLPAHSRLTRCPQCHHHYIAIGPDGHVCHRRLADPPGYALWQRQHWDAVLGAGHHAHRRWDKR